MKGHNFLPLAVSLVFLSGCQQLNESVNSVNGAINSSLSSLNSTVDKALGVSASGQDSGPATSITGLGAVCKDGWITTLVLMMQFLPIRKARKSASPER